MHKYHKCCSELIWPFYGLLQQLWGKTSLISYLRDFSAQVLQIVFSAHFNRFPASYNCMSEKFKNLISPVVKCTSVTNRVLSSFERFTAYYNCMRKNFKHLISPWVHCKVSQIVFWAHLTVLRLITTVWGKTSKISYLREFSAQVSQIVFLAHLTVLRFFITKWRKTSKILYLNKFTAQVSQIVFWAHLTVLRLITSVWGKTSKISYLREFSAQVSQIVFWVHLTVLRLITTVWGKTSKISYLRVQCTSITNRVLSSKLITTVWGKTSKIFILWEFSAQVSQIVFLAHLTVLGLTPTVWG